MANQDGWKFEDDVDSQMAMDINRDRNMMDYVMYNNNGIPFITLAGIMKVANNDGFTTEICDINRTDFTVEAVVKVTTPDNPDDEQPPRSAYSGRTEYLKDRSGKPDQFALTKAINIAIKCAAKTLLYGHPDIEEMLTEFVKANKFILPDEEKKPEPTEKTKTEPEPTPQAEPEPTLQAEPEPALQAEPEPALQAEPEPALQAEPEPAKTAKDGARQCYEYAKEALAKLNVHDDDVATTFRKWCFYFFNSAPEALGEESWDVVISNFSKDDFGFIGKFFKEVPNSLDSILERNGYEPAPEKS